jgi:hypothetical protein
MTEEANAEIKLVKGPSLTTSLSQPKDSLSSAKECGI